MRTPSAQDHSASSYTRAGAVSVQKISDCPLTVRSTGQWAAARGIGNAGCVSSSYYTRLEQGQSRNASPQVLAYRYGSNLMTRNVSTYARWEQPSTSVRPRSAGD